MISHDIYPLKMVIYHSYVMQIIELYKPTARHHHGTDRPGGGSRDRSDRSLPRRMSVSQDWQRGPPKITEERGISMDPIRRKRENVGKITKKSWGFSEFHQNLEVWPRRVGISPLNQGNMGGWWDLSKQFQRYPIGDETLGMFSNFLDIAILQKSSISSRYICIINIPIYVYIYI